MADELAMLRADVIERFIQIENVINGLISTLFWMPLCTILIQLSL
ncbi:MAG: hypothetical protein K0S36_1161 [Nitrosospira multiformis]|jgi:hypothetical protein|nr:hypothetical protein [Nitrosospira multiformis]